MNPCQLSLRAVSQPRVCPWRAAACKGINGARRWSALPLRSRQPRARGVVGVRSSAERQGGGEAGSGSVASSVEEGLAEEVESTALPESFCIIESPTAVKDFADMQLSEVRANIEARRNKIFLLMEEVRRLRIQERLKKRTNGVAEPEGAFINEQFPSALPFAPPLNAKTIKQYYVAFGAVIFAIIVFGGLISPILEVKLGVGGQTYAEFIESIHLPGQLSQVDPIVASFCGGAVGVLTALLLVEENNVKRQAKARCAYCEGTGYITCGNCFAAGTTVVNNRRCMCATCSGTGKVACTACLCTGKMMATEHDPRIDPFD